MSRKNTRKAVLLGDLDTEEFSLRRALSIFISDSPESNLNEIMNITNKIYNKYNIYYKIKTILFGVFGFSFISYSIAYFIDIFYINTLIVSYLITSVILFIIMIIPIFLWHSLEYGWGGLENPVNIPCDIDDDIDRFLSLLQKELSPRAYYYSRFTGKRIPIERRCFFGKFRYLLFSEHRQVRSLVSLYNTGLPAPADIFISRPDLEAMLSNSPLKRKGGPGRKPKYRYADAVIDLIGHPKLGQLNLSNPIEAVSEIENMLKKWFDENPDPSGNVPRKVEFTPLAKKLFDRLNFLASQGGRKPVI